MRELAQRGGVSLATVHSVESGEVASLESYARLGAALGMRPTLEFADPHPRRTAAELVDEHHRYGQPEDREQRPEPARGPQ